MSQQTNRQEHRQMEPLLAVYRALDEAQRRRVEDHVQACPACARQLAAFRAIDRQLLNLREHDQAHLKATRQGGRPDLSAFRAQPARWLHRFLAALDHPRTVVGSLVGLALLLAIAALFTSWFASLQSGPGVPMETTLPAAAVGEERLSPSAQFTGNDDLGRVAYVQDGDIWMKQLPDGEPQRLTNGGNNKEPRWSPSGQWLAFRKDKFVWVLKIAAPEEAHSLQTTASDVDMGFSWAPTEDILAFTAGNKLQLFEAQSDAITTIVSLPGDGEEMYRLIHPFWKPDGSAIAYERVRRPAGISETFQGEHGVWLVELESGETAELVDSGIPERGEAVLAGWTSDGRYLLFWQADILSASSLMDGAPLYALPVGDAEEQEPVAVTVPVAGQALAPMLARHDFLAAAPHSSEVAIVLGGGRDTWGNKRVGGASPETENWRSYTPDDRVAISPAWSPDGGKLATVTMPANATTAEEAMRARRVEVWENGERRRLTQNPDYRDENPMWSAGGSHILFARLDRNDQVSLWLVPTAETATSQDAQMVVEALSPPPPDTGWFGVYGYVDWSEYYDWWRGSGGADTETLPSSDAD